MENRIFSTSDDVKINYKISGNGPVILLVHGWLGTSYTWRKVAPIFVEKGYTVLCPDMKGYGDSDKPENGYDALTLAKELIELLNHESLKNPVHIVGWDMGALPAYIFAAHFPERTASLAYLDEPLPSVNIQHLTSFTEDNFGGYWHFGFNHSKGLPELLIQGKERQFFKYLHGLMLTNKQAITDQDLDEYMRSYATLEGIRGSNGWYRDMFTTTNQFKKAISNGKLKLPVIGIGGQNGTPYTQSQLEGVIADNVAGGIIPNCGHLIAEECPNELTDMLIGFYKAL